MQEELSSFIPKGIGKHGVHVWRTKPFSATDVERYMQACIADGAMPPALLRLLAELCLGRARIPALVVQEFPDAKTLAPRVVAG